MIIEGAFSCSNGSLIDEYINKDRSSAVITHESVHYELGVTTTYGQLLIMLDKNSKFDLRAKEVYGALFSHVNRMQERAAVNVELLTEYLSNDGDAYLVAIESLKERNRTYYNYFRKLCCINGKVKSKKDATTAASVIRYLAKWAMNINLDMIPFDRFFTAKDIQRFFSIGDNSSKFNPNKRFDIIVNCLFRSNGNETDLDSVISGSIPLDAIGDLGMIHEKAERAAVKVFESSPIKERLIRRIETIGTRPVEIVHENVNLLTLFPIDFNSCQMTPKNMILDFDSFLEKLNEQRNREIIVQNQLGGFEDIYLCTIHNDNGAPATYLFSVTNEFEFLEVLQKLNCRTIFVQTKLVNRLHKSLKRVVGKLPIFIYYDAPVVNALRFIKDFYQGGKYYFQKKNSYLILVIYKRSFYSIFNVVDEAKELLETILANDKIMPSSVLDFWDQVERINEDMRSNNQII